MDKSRFYAAYRDDGHGRAAYEPSMMMALILYCWARGVWSWRAIEHACIEDVACRGDRRSSAARSRDDRPLRERHERALGDLCSGVLTCAPTPGWRRWA